MAEAKKKKKYKYYKGSFVIGKKPDGSPDRIYVCATTKAERDEKLAEAKRLHSRGLKLGEMTVYQWTQQWESVFLEGLGKKQKNHYKAKMRLEVKTSLLQDILGMALLALFTKEG